jgi:hypothetical protein
MFDSEKFPLVELQDVLYEYVLLRTHSLFYCSGLIECPITIFPFITMQHAHFCCIQILASSCLQIEHIQAWVEILSILFFSLDFTSTYNHNATSGKPIVKNMKIVRIGIRKTNNEMPKHTVPIPRTSSQRVVISILSPTYYISLPFLNNFYT